MKSMRAVSDDYMVKHANNITGYLMVSVVWRPDGSLSVLAEDPLREYIKLGGLKSFKDALRGFMESVELLANNLDKNYIIYGVEEEESRQ